MPHNVLIIAPSKEAHRGLRNKLSADLQTYVANGLPQSLSIMQKHLIDLVLLVAGEKPEPEIHLCRELKSNPFCSHIPAILITAEDNLQIRIKCLEAGADVQLGGPVFREYLDVLIRNLVNNRLKVRRYLTHGPVGGEHASRVQEREQIRKKLTDCLFDQDAQKDLTVEQLAKRMHMSRPTLYRKMKHITNLTPNELINEAKLRKAAELLAAGELKACEVARLVGYSSHSSFGKTFLKQFGVTPVTYKRMNSIINAA